MSLKLCDGGKGFDPHGEICFDTLQCPRGCPLCEALDEISLLHARLDRVMAEMVGLEQTQKAERD